LQIWKELTTVIHPIKSVPILASLTLLLVGSAASAQSYFDDFESYNLGTLDKNDIFTNGPNRAPNGSGNPWFGPEISDANAVVIGTENGVTPVSGQQMIRGQYVAGVDKDQDWYNLAYRLNNGLPFTGNISLDWWFYDLLGPGGTDFRDFVALGFYDTAPPDRDAPDNYNLNVGFRQIQRLSLGADPNINSIGFDPDYYQARVVQADDGYAGGWFNTATARSVGWHHGAIVIGPMLADGTNDVTFFIDDMTTPTLEHNSMTNFGYNVIEINMKYGAQTGYFDDINFAVISGDAAAPPRRSVSLFPGAKKSGQAQTP
jgi:hypothetical protein